jgi:methylmalonyl-CoA mutase
VPIVGVNTFVRDGVEDEAANAPRELIRSDDAEKRRQLDNLRAFQARHAQRADAALAGLQAAAVAGGNLFDELMQTVEVASLGQISDALFSVGGRYRRAM